MGVTNPATEETICEIEEAGEQDVENAIQAAHEAFKTWKHVTAKDRAAMIRNLAALIRKNQDELAQIECLGNKYISRQRKTSVSSEVGRSHGR